MTPDTEGDDMQALAVPAPATTTADTGPVEASPPAPQSTMLAVVGRIASHAGEPVSVTLTGATNAIVITLDHLDAYAGWCREVDMPPGALVRRDELGSLSTATVRMHGWSLTLQLLA